MKIVILGCGYVGEAAARLFLQTGHTVIGTTTNPMRKSELQNSGINALIWQAGDLEGLENLTQDADTILIAVAPSSRDQSYESVYLETARTVKDVLQRKKSIAHLAVISSTSVYGDNGGEWVDETSTLQTNSLQSEILVATERLYQTLAQPITLIRPGEIIGPERMPDPKTGMTLFGNPQFYTNLVHRDDLVRFISTCFDQRLTGIFNCCNDLHIPRSLYYTKLGMDISKLTWKTSSRSGNKRVSSAKAKLHGFSFKYPYFPFDTNCDFTLS